MLSLLFITHNFHRKTRSNLFFVEILKEKFDVTELYLGPDRYSLDTSLFDVKPDYVVLWQLDYLAPIFLNKGIRTLVVPMYDGSANLGHRHWQLSSGAYFLSFSYHIHHKITQAGCRSLLVKYFPESEPTFVQDYSELKAFWWMRQVDGVVSLDRILGQWGDSLSALHIHLVPDNSNTNVEQLKESLMQEFSKWKASKGRENFHLTLSSWFEYEEDMLAVLNRSNVYIAPRASEGIGMGFLKAMSKGMIVLAHDSPTHNEYIAHGVNGFLFKENERNKTSLLERRQVIGKLARKTSEEGYKKWSSLIPSILDYVCSIPSPNHCVNYLTKKSYDLICDNYFKGTSFYTKTIERVASVVVAYSPKTETEINTPFKSLSSFVPVCETNKTYGFGEKEARQFFYEGWLKGVENTTWIGGKEASLCFSFSEKTGAKNYFLKFRGRTTLKNIEKDKKPLKIFLNQKEIFSDLLTESYQVFYEVRIPQFLLKAKEPNVLRFQCDSLMKHQAFEFPISCMIASFEIIKKEFLDEEIKLEEAHLKCKILTKKSEFLNKIFPS